MHKSELEGMTLAELTALAGKLGADLSDDQTTLIYNILDAQSLQLAAETDFNVVFAWLKVLFTFIFYFFAVNYNSCFVWCILHRGGNFAGA